MHKEGSFAANLVCGSAKLLAAGAAKRQQARDPVAVRNYASGVHDLALDTEVRFGYLAEALATDRAALFTGQLSWLKILCASRGVPTHTIRDNIECMLEEVEYRLPEACAQRAAIILRTGIGHLDQASSAVPSYLAEERPHVDLARRFLLAVLEAREQDAIKLVMDAFAGGLTIQEVHEHVLQRVQLEIGRMWQMDEVTIAEEHYCTGIVATLCALLRAAAPRVAPNGKRVIAAAVSSETHDLGIRIVAQMFELEGWSTLQLGADTPTRALIEGARDFGCDVFALSTSIVLYVRRTADIIAELRSNPETSQLPILVGGQPFNMVDDLWQIVGADGCAKNASSAPRLAAELLANT